MKNNCCNPIKLPTISHCDSGLKNKVTKVIYNAETKEVFDEYNNFIGFGEYNNGILKVTINDNRKSTS